MSSDLLVTGTGAGGSLNGHAKLARSTPGRFRGPRRAHGPLNKKWVVLHRWSSLILGLLLLLEATSGAVLLYENEIVRALHPEQYTATPSATPLDEIQVLELVRAQRPEFGATGSQLTHDGVYLVYGPKGSAQEAVVDPGAGRITGIGELTPGWLRLLENVHMCGLTCEGYPGYQAWLTNPMPAFFGPAFFGKDVTIGGYLLGGLGVLLIFLCLSGLALWWPGIRAGLTGLSVRRRRGAYARDLDLHRVVGVVAVPFLLMWGFTGTMFYFDWPAQAWFTALPGEAREDPQAPTAGTGNLLSLVRARDTALALHPGARVTGIREAAPEDRGGTYYVRLSSGYDPYEYSTFPGSHGLTIDSHGGGVQDYAPAGDHPLTESWFYDGVLYGLHFGTVVPAVPRLVWLAFGLTPVLLAVTGVTVWLTKRGSRRNRRRRRRARIAGP